MIHTYMDKSTLNKISAKTLVSIPVWRGNRFIDLNHANQIKKDIGDNIQTLDSANFHVVKYKDENTYQTYLVDGQHRQYVIRTYFEENFCMPDFNVLVHEKTVEGESDAIEYFNTLNNVKPQQENDLKLLANKYIVALEKKFPKLIKPIDKKTKRPFLSSNDLRKVLEENGTLLKQSPQIINTFIEKVDSWNKKKIQEFDLRSAFIAIKDKTILESCLEKKFVLAFDPKLPWIKECLC